MGRKGGWILVLAALLGGGAWEAAESTARADQPPPETMETVSLVPARTFVPPGFDDNDNAQIVLTGMYANTCYKTGPAKVSVDRAARQIRIQNQAYHFRSSWCLGVLVPYVQVVDIGLLNAGEFKLLVDDLDGNPVEVGGIRIARSTEHGPYGPDDVLYAPVKEASVSKSANGATLTLSGVFPSGCMELGEVKALYRVENIIEVLPAARVRESGCEPGRSAPFQAKLALENRWKGETLIHIRSLEGRAVNKIEEF